MKDAAAEGAPVSVSDAAPQPAAPSAAPAAAAGTPVLRVVLVILCGIVVAMNVGKMPPSLPSLRTELMLGLTAVAVLVSMINVVGSITGGVVGVLVDRWGPRRMVGAALAAAALGNLVGALSPSAAWLLIGRLCEGVGLILVLSAAPVLLQRLSAPKDRGLVMGFWGTFMPVGSAVSLLVAPTLLGLGTWRLLWVAAGALAVAALAALWIVERRHPEPLGGGAAKLADLPRVLRTAVLPLGFAFAAFSFSYIGVLSLLPTWLIETQHFSLGVASAVAIAYAAANAAGNITGGMLLRRRVPSSRLIAVAAGVTGLLSLAMFLPGPPAWVRLPAAIVFGTFGGWIPVSVFATAPRLAPEPRMAGAAMGLTVQLLNLGTLFGPIVIARAVDAADHDWAAAAPVLVAAAAVSLACGLAIDARAKALAG